jgi:hypothetical protein
MVYRGLSVGTGVFMGLALLISGCGVPVLARDRQRLLAARRAAEEQERRSEFRATLTTALRSLAVNGIDFESMVAENGLSRSEANSVADELYRRMADRVVVAGVIAQREQQKLRLLAKVLQMTPERVTRLDSEAVAASKR